MLLQQLGWPQFLNWIPNLSLVSGSSKLSSFPCALSAKCAFLGLLRESVRCVYGTPTLLPKNSFTGLLPTFVLESFWRSISRHLTWISCGDWIDRRRHSKTFIFAINQLVFCYLRLKSSCSKTTWVFYTKLVIAAWLINSIEIFAAQNDKLNGLIQTLATWLTNFFDIFVPLTFFLTICERSQTSTTSRILRQYKRVIWAIIGYRIFIAARRCNAICNVLHYCHKVVIKYISHPF